MRRSGARIARRLLLASSALCVFLLAHALQGTADGSAVIDRVVAVVNDEIITLSELEREEREAAEQNLTMSRALILDELINRKLQLSAAKRSGLDATEKEVTDRIEDIKRKNSWNDRQFETALSREGMTVDQYRVQLKEELTLSRVVNKYVRSGLSIDDAEIKQYYDQHRDAFALPEEIRVRQVFLAIPDGASPSQIKQIEERARMVAERARSGEDFASLVRRFSEGPTAKLEGDLGYIARDHALPEIDLATRSLTSGQVAGPLKTRSGFHIIRLEDVRRPLKPFESVREEIANTVFRQKAETSYRAWLQTLRAESHVEIRL